MPSRDPVGDLGFDPATAGVAATIVAVAVLQTSWGTWDDLDLLTALGAWTSEEGWREPWRLLASTWLHGSLEHVAGNLVALLVFGWPLERAIGWRRWLLLWFASGLVGAVAGAATTGAPVMVGASGAIFGLYGATAALAVVPRRALHGGEVAVLREAVWPLGVSMVLESFLPAVAWAAHLGGLVVGAALGGSGWLTLGLAPRASADDVVPPVHWGRAVLGTLVIGALACGCPLLGTLLLVAYVAVVFLVARAEPRYVAEEGWTVSLSALGIASLLWGALGIAWWVGQPWLPTGGPHWVELGPGLPRIQVHRRRPELVTDGGPALRFGAPGDALVVTVHLTEPDEAWSFADRWTRLATQIGPTTGVVADEGGCPTLRLPGSVVVMGPTQVTTIEAESPDGPVDPVIEPPRGCRDLPPDARAEARERLGDLAGAARVRHEAHPDDVHLLIRYLATNVGCEERLPRLDGLVLQDPVLAVECARAGASCPGPEVERWLEAALARAPDDGQAWWARADVARERGDAKAERRALRRAVELLEGADRDAVAARLDAGTLP